MMHFDMPRIIDCAAEECAYNRGKQCNAVAITVGGPGDKCPLCDTEIVLKSKAGVEGQPGEVGACHKADCQYNCDLECSACQGIHVGVHQGHADCETYTQKK